TTLVPHFKLVGPRWVFPIDFLVSRAGIRYQASFEEVGRVDMGSKEETATESKAAFSDSSDLCLEIVMPVHLLKRTWPRCLRLALVVMLITPIFEGRGNAQTAGTGSIQGIVSDPAGAVVQNSSVTLTNEATNVQHRTASGGDGLFSFPNI